MAITVYTAARLKILLDEKPLAAAGGEGSVHRVIATPNYSSYCVKIYHTPKRTLIRRRKVEFMIRNKPQNTITSNYLICFPTELVFDFKNEFIGFLMPLAFPNSEKLYELTTTKISRRLPSEWNKFDRTVQEGFEKRLKVCVNIAISVHSLHQTGNFTVVDYKPQNILLTPEGKISITDVDSFQISENKKVLHHSEVATPEYSPPESVRLNPATIFIPESWDRFSMAVSFYEILYGIHPFTSTCDGHFTNVTTISEKIQKGLFVHGSKKNYLTVIPKIHNDFIRLPESIKDLFIQTFEKGHSNPVLRPSAYDWGNTIYNELDLNISIKPNLISNQKSGKKQLVGLKNKSGSKVTYIPTGSSSKRSSSIQNKQNSTNYYLIFYIVICVLLVGVFINDYQKKNEIQKSQLPIANPTKYYSNPKFNSRSVEYVSIVKIERDEKYFKVYFEYLNYEKTNKISLGAPNSDIAYYIIANSTRYNLLSTDGISNVAGVTSAPRGVPILFSATFEPIPRDIPLINVIEGLNGSWSFYGVQIPPTQEEIKDIQVSTKTIEGDKDNIELRDENPIEEDEGKIFTVVEEMPQFPGGEEKLLIYLRENINYPSLARQNGIQGRVYVTFVVDKDGKVKDAKVLRGILGGCDEEALRVVRSMPKWKAGRQNGRSVQVQYNLPVPFTLN